MNEVQSTLAASQAAATERQRGTAKGGDYEAQVVAEVALSDPGDLWKLLPGDWDTPFTTFEVNEAEIHALEQEMEE